MSLQTGKNELETVTSRRRKSRYMTRSLFTYAAMACRNLSNKRSLPMMNQEIRERYNQWLESPVFDETTKYELSDLSEDEIIDRFYTELKFGTSGVRGKLGAGTNRMNIYLIRRLSWSLGQALLAEDIADRGVVIAYDSRRNSIDFALETALVLGALGIKSYLFDDLRPTPELSFAVRHLEATAGVMITASHNPKEYNGYKVYWDDGAQIPPHQADVITRFLNECSWDVPVLTDGEALENGVLEYIGGYIDEAYLQHITDELLNTELIHTHGDQLNIVYTPLHGAGRSSVQQILSNLGFTRVTTVPEQAEPDTEFSTVPSPNPEDSGAWTLALKLAASVQGADLLLATDPDSDRLGVQCRMNNGSYYHFTGNQIGILLTNYILETLSSRGDMPDDGVIISNYVSTAMTRKLAEAYGMELRIVPVGFKFIGEQIKSMEESGKGIFLFGFEESIGYLKGTYARDKDAVLAAALTAEAALYYKANHGKTLYDVLTDLYEKYGYFIDRQESLKLEGMEGQQRIASILEALSTDSRPEIGGLKVATRSFDSGLFALEFENCGFVKARASGTEPKIRFYFCICGETMEQATTALERVKKELFEII